MGTKTALYLAAQYDRAAIPVAIVCRDYFDGLSPDNFLRKVGSGEIKLPVIRMYEGQKAAKAVHVDDLADFLDARREAAQKEVRQLSR